MKKSEFPKDDEQELTIMLRNLQSNQTQATGQLIQAVYDQLRIIARNRLSRERSDHTLQPTELVHEAYSKIAGSLGGQDWQDRNHFFAMAAEAMRRILINYARARNAGKRGSGRRPEVINVVELANEQDPEQILAVDEAIQELAEEDPKLGKLVYLRFFAGLSVEQIAEATDTSPRTVARQWNFARAWLTKSLKEKFEE
jgi:RNA polymerase sigma factor (TIGR02999 family)